MLRKFSHRLALLALLISSLFFYAYWNPIYLLLIIGSVVINYFIGKSIIANRYPSPKLRKVYFFSGLIFNLGLIAYFKYANFFINTTKSLGVHDITIEEVVLPLAISFFTFQQITFLVDAFRNEIKECDFTDYALFVTFFPQLIAGPIVHQSEMMEQFQKGFTNHISVRFVTVGTTLFIIGLFKKVIIADSLSPIAQEVFSTLNIGSGINFLYAWKGAFAYTFQLYFDFSGYSDMAMGLALLFGIKLPLNFNSPYKSKSIIEFWRRWHITLSRFLRDYLYIILGGSKSGTIRTIINLFLTMLLGGLWHGAGWTFILWGGVHACYLTINHLWRIFKPRCLVKKILYHELSWFITFLSVVFGWVIFRSENLEVTRSILTAMLGFEGIQLRDLWLDKMGSLGSTINELKYVSSSSNVGVTKTDFIILALLILWLRCGPNSQQFLHKYMPLIERDRDLLGKSEAIIDLKWKPTPIFAVLIALMAFTSIINLNSVSEFLYFQF